mmetsp:Transcript_12015/g.22981  ORF Transcript_12015/g.22981 Transcript_12015/m.22981 type:complete len:101 (+) Transcript_12015:1007-1309(+)
MSCRGASCNAKISRLCNQGPAVSTAVSTPSQKPWTFHVATRTFDMFGGNARLLSELMTENEVTVTLEYIFFGQYLLCLSFQDVSNVKYRTFHTGGKSNRS